MREPRRRGAASQLALLIAVGIRLHHFAEGRRFDAKHATTWDLAAGLLIAFATDGILVAASAPPRERSRQGHRNLGGNGFMTPAAWADTTA